MKKLFKTFIAIIFIGSAINAQQTIKGKVLDETGEAVIGATIANTSTNSGTVTELDGTYALEANDGDLIRVTYIGFTDHEFKVMAGQMDYPIELATGLELDLVTVTGSRGKPRTALETAVPIDVIGGAQLSKSPQADLAQVLQYAAPSFHSTKQNIGHGSDHIDPMALRGLGADQTLVLINGKRRHASSLMNVNGTVGRGQVGTDLNAIPYGFSR